MPLSDAARAVGTGGEVRPPRPAGRSHVPWPVNSHRAWSVTAGASSTRRKERSLCAGPFRIEWGWAGGASRLPKLRRLGRVEGVGPGAGVPLPQRMTASPRWVGGGRHPSGSRASLAGGGAAGGAPRRGAGAGRGRAPARRPPLGNRRCAARSAEDTRCARCHAGTGSPASPPRAGASPGPKGGGGLVRARRRPVVPSATADQVQRGGRSLGPGGYDRIAS